MKKQNIVICQFKNGLYGIRKELTWVERLSTGFAGTKYLFCNVNGTSCGFYWIPGCFAFSAMCMGTLTQAQEKLKEISIVAEPKELDYGAVVQTADELECINKE